MIKVYLVDDEFFVRTSLRKNMPWKENDFEVVGEANNGKTALEEILVLRPDIAIVDINMPIYDGLELIRRLEEQKINCRYIILTGYNEFQYAQQALRLGVYDYILKPIDYRLLLNTLIELRQEVCSDTMLSQKISDLESEKKAMLLEQYYNDLVNCSSFIQADSYYGQSILTPEDLVLGYGAYSAGVVRTSVPLTARDFSDMIKKYSFENYVCCCNEKKQIFLLFDSSDKKTAVDFWEYCMQSLNKLHFSPHIGVGKPYPDMNLLYRSYNEAQIALRNDSLLKKGLIYYEELDHEIGYQKVEVKFERRLKACVLDKNFSGTQQLLEEFYNSFLPGGYLFHTLMFNTVELIHLLVDTLSSKLSMPVSVLNSSDSILDILNDMTDINEIKSWTKQIYTSAMQNFLLSNNTDSGVAEKIERFIEKNYSNPDFSIPMLSESLFLNYSYLCTCFKRDRHMTINDYLNHVRIHKAVEMFENGVDNVAYVSEKTGFNNPGYFSKKFKKEIGLTPSEYIKTFR